MSGIDQMETTYSQHNDLTSKAGNLGDTSVFFQFQASKFYHIW